jgi:hypothetical protein
VTVPATPVPLAEYDGNGTTTQFYYGWRMLQESALEVRVDNVFNEDWTDQDPFIVFNTAPVFGAKVQIYRRTEVHQPEDYEKFRGFKANKTELTMDRSFMIAQELEAGIVGAPDLFTTPAQNGMWINSERGTDAFIPLWASDDFPDPSILWAGNRLEAYKSSASAFAQTQVIWWSIAAGGELGKSNFQYGQGNSSLFTPWLDYENAPFGSYWMRVTDIDSTISAGMSFEILDKDLNVQAFGVPFDPINSQIIIKITSGLPPVVSFTELLIEICADDGQGAPDENWASRQVYLALEYII